MENASKALLMAGGVLVGIILIGMLVYMANTISSIPSAQQTEQEIKKIQEFNKVYESYDKTKLRGIEIVSLVNRAIDYNKKADENERIKVIVKIIMASRGYDASGDAQSGDGLDIKDYEFTGNEIKTFNDILGDEDKKHSFMYSRYFKCTGIFYNENSGRVKEMKFIEIEI